VSGHVRELPAARRVGRETCMRTGLFSYRTGLPLQLMLKKDSVTHNLIRTGDAELRLSFVIWARKKTIGTDGLEGGQPMLSKIMLALALVMAALAAVPASAGPDDIAQIQSSSSDRIANTGGAGGNLVPLW
jgi:hypothetical protein